MSYGIFAKLDELTQKLWRLDSCPSAKYVIDVLRDITDELRPEIIRLFMSRCKPSTNEVLELLNQFPGNGCLILQWLAYLRFPVADLLLLLTGAQDQRVKEGLGLLVLGHSDATSASYLAVAKAAPELQEHIWRRYQEEPACEGLHLAFVSLAKYSPRLKERIAKYFLTSDYYLPGLLIGLEVPSVIDRSVEIILRKDNTDGCVEVLEKIDLSSSQARRACYLLLQHGKDSFEMMLAVMIAARTYHDGDCLVARNRFVQLVQDKDDEELLPYVQRAIAILQPAGDPCRDVTIHLLEDVLSRLKSTSSLSEADHILRSMKALAL